MQSGVATVIMGLKHSKWATIFKVGRKDSRWGWNIQGGIGNIQSGVGTFKVGLEHSKWGWIIQSGVGTFTVGLEHSKWATAFKVARIDEAGIQVVLGETYVIPVNGVLAGVFLNENERSRAKD